MKELDTWICRCGASNAFWRPECRECDAVEERVSVAEDESPEPLPFIEAEESMRVWRDENPVEEVGSVAMGVDFEWDGGLIDE